MDYRIKKSVRLKKQKGDRMMVICIRDLGTDRDKGADGDLGLGTS